MKTRRLIEILALGLWTTAAIGCVNNLPETRHGQAAGEWTVRLPSTQGTFAKMAMGTGGNAEPAAVSDTQPLLAVKRPAPKKHVKQVNTPVAAPVVVASTQPAAPAEMAKPVATPTLLASNEPSAEQRYAQRETQSKKLEDFRGGDAIVISGGVLLVVLLIVILVLLLR